MITDKLKQYENKYESNHYQGDGTQRLILKEGRLPILLSVPHSVKHRRNESLKEAEVNTGSMAELLQELTGCHMMAALYSDSADYNYDEAKHCAYKQALKEYVKNHKIKVVLDIHGANETREFAVELGTVDERDASLKSYGFIKEIICCKVEEYCGGFADRTSVTVNTLFSASGKNTVTNYIAGETDAACVQLEINWMYRNPKEEERLEAMVQALQAVIWEINDRMNGETGSEDTVR